MRYAARLKPILILAAGVLTAAAVTASAGPSAHTAAAPGPRLVIPGRPGEQATISSSDRVKAPDGDAYTAADVWFVRMMIPHHAQAIEMAALAPKRAHNPQIAAIAGRMQAAQLPEILALRAWLSARGLDEKAGEGGHDHATMPGMQPPEAMRALADASGEGFDRMFVQMMSAHHRGAIDMAELRLRSTGDLMIERIATEVAFEQSVEISRLRDIVGS